MSVVTAPIGEAVEIKTVNVKDSDRFIVAHVVGYASTDGVTTIKEAAAAGLAMLYDSRSDGTIWSVYDRQTGLTSYLDQKEFEDIIHDKGFIT